MHRCSKCKTEKPDSQFYVAKTGYITGWCKPCQRAAVKMRRNEVIDYIRQQKEKPCADCGESYPYYVMDFDHLPQYEKSFGLNSSIAREKGFKQIKAEIEKCEVVCSNCHRIRTYNRLEKDGAPTRTRT